MLACRPCSQARSYPMQCNPRTQELTAMLCSVALSEKTLQTTILKIKDLRAGAVAGSRVLTWHAWVWLLAFSNNQKPEYDKIVDTRCSHLLLLPFLRSYELDTPEECSHLGATYGALTNFGQPHLGPIISAVFLPDDSFAMFIAVRQLDSSLSRHNWPGCCSSWVEALPKSDMFTNSYSRDVLEGTGFATVRPCLCKCHQNLSKRTL